MTGRRVKNRNKGVVLEVEIREGSRLVTRRRAKDWNKGVGLEVGKGEWWERYKG